MSFEKEFLDNYLRFGLGSMTKTDIDALVMYLIDKYGLSQGEPMKEKSNQMVSEQLKTPVSKVKNLRYAASLKFSESIETEAKSRFKNCLLSISFSTDAKEVKFLVEDQLAKTWFQGKLKEHNLFYDGSFNSEAIKVDSLKFLDVLKVVIPENDITELQKKLENVLSEESKSKDIRSLKKSLLEFVGFALPVIELVIAR